MKKTGKPVLFTIRFENDKLIAEASIAGTVLTVAAVDLAKEADRSKRRAMLQAINDHSTLASKADLEAFDKKFPDPVKVAAVKAEVDKLKFEITRDNGFLADTPKGVLTMESGRREVSFKRWAQGKTYEKFLLFVIAVDDGGDTKKAAEQFIKTGAPQFIVLPDATRKAVEDALGKGQKPDLKTALKQAAAVVDQRMLPAYNTETNNAIKARIAKSNGDLVNKLKEYKDLGGK